MENNNVSEIFKVRTWQILKGVRKPKIEQYISGFGPNQLRLLYKTGIKYDNIFINSNPIFTKIGKLICNFEKFVFFVNNLKNAPCKTKLL